MQKPLTIVSGWLSLWQLLERSGFAAFHSPSHLLIMTREQHDEIQALKAKQLKVKKNSPAWWEIQEDIEFLLRANY